MASSKNYCCFLNPYHSYSKCIHSDSAKYLAILAYSCGNRRDFGRLCSPRSNTKLDFDSSQSILFNNYQICFCFFCFLKELRTGFGWRFEPKGRRGVGPPKSLLSYRRAAAGPRRETNGPKATNPPRPKDTSPSSLRARKSSSPAASLWANPSGTRL